MSGLRRRLVRTAEIMGTVVSVHMILDDTVSSDPDSPDEALPGGCPDDIICSAVDRCFDQLREIDRVFSTYRADSDISLMRAGLLTEFDADRRVAAVHRACERAETETGGLFTAHWRGGFDPTGYVKGWAVENAHDRWLRPLLALPCLVAIGASAGGDMQLSTREGSGWRWSVGIVDPDRPGRVLATAAVTNGAVATSGTAERGAHIVDPRTGRPALAAASATVLADRLSDADVWATAAVVAGTDDLGWVRRAPRTSGMVVATSGRIRRWAGGVEVGMAESAGDAAAVSAPDPAATRS